MKKYVNPEIEFIEFESTDIIATSIGTEMLPIEDDDVIWEF